jgi:hypothetical protein
MTCLDCKDEIAAARIRVMPKAARCAACQGAAERSGAWRATPVPVSVLANTGLTAIAVGLPVSPREFREWDEFLKGDLS